MPHLLILTFMFALYCSHSQIEAYGINKPPKGAPLTVSLPGVLVEQREEGNSMPSFGELGKLGCFGEKASSKADSCVTGHHVPLLGSLDVTGEAGCAHDCPVHGRLGQQSTPDPRISAEPFYTSTLAFQIRVVLGNGSKSSKWTGSAVENSPCKLNCK